ncbi:MAG TPA: helix-turn-helix transcriptional regulator, partial [Candidatus Saccharimonadia bacterium]
AMQPPLTPAVFHILLALVQGDQHGYGIMKHAEHQSDGKVKLGPATLYTTIRKLQNADYLEELSERPDTELDDARRRYYRLTPAGRQLLGAELERMDRLVRLGSRLGAYHRTDFGRA